MPTEKYFGKICNLHLDLGGERYATNRGCIRCVYERARVRRLTNPEKAKQYQRQRYSDHLEASRAYSRNYARKWKEQNREWVREYSRVWYADNSVKRIAKEAPQRARRRGQRPVLTAIERAQYQEFFDIARARSMQTGVKWTVDHDLPLARGGLDHPSNLMLLPARINEAKGARHDSTLEYLLS